MKNEQSKDIGNIRYTRQWKIKQKHNTICVGHYYPSTIHKQTQIT
jgi:hypothetical protein